MKKKSYYKPKGKKKAKVTQKKYKSYYKPKSKKTTKSKVVKKKYKSYYKPKKVRDYENTLAESLKKVRKNPKNDSALIQPLNPHDVNESEINVPIKTSTSKRPVKYLNNRDLLTQVILSKKQGKMTNELAKMLQLLTMRYGKKGNFAGYCVDNKTQALTKRGWLYYDEIIKNDEILSYDITSKDLKWSKILDLYVNVYNGKMHYLTTQGLDALVTPNHKFVSVEYGLKRVEDIICNEHIVLMGNPVEQLPAHLSDSEIEIIGWIITEGHYHKHSINKRSISISQNPGPNSTQIEKCLQSANVHYSKYKHTRSGTLTFHCTGPFIKQIYDVIAPNRVLAMDFIVSLSQHQRQVLIKTMIAGDGWNRPSDGTSYIQKDKKHVDAFLVLCTLAGLTTHTSLRGYKTPPSKIHPGGTISECITTNIYNEPKLYCKAEWINFHGGKQGPGGRREQKPNIPTQDYNGVIWCPKTEYGTFVCRRNDSIYVTGNTYNDDMQSYAMLMIVKTWQGFDPAKSSNPFAWFTQCIKNSFIQYLNYEKRQRDIRDEVLVDSGMLPSYNYQHEYAEEHKSVDSPENETVELPSKPSHNDVTFEVPEEDDTPVEVLQY